MNSKRCRTPDVDKPRCSTRRRQTAAAVYGPGLVVVEGRSQPRRRLQVHDRLQYADRSTHRSVMFAFYMSLSLVTSQCKRV